MTLNLKERVGNLAALAGVRSTPSDQCWIDARNRCPYGSPEGQFILRPESFCNRSCRHFTDGAVGLYAESDAQELGQEQLQALFNDRHVTVETALRELANELPESSVEQLTLVLAADIIDEHRLDHDILRREDMERE